MKNNMCEHNLHVMNFVGWLKSTFKQRIIQLTSLAPRDHLYAGLLPSIDAPVR